MTAKIDFSLRDIFNDEFGDELSDVFSFGAAGITIYKGQRPISAGQNALFIELKGKLR